MSGPAANVRLTESQRSVMNQIISYGKANGFSDEQIRIAVKTAYMESSLGQHLGPNPKGTASGLFGYTDDEWDGHNGKKSNNSDQIRAFYADITDYSWRYDNQPYGSIPKKDVSLGEYIYIKPHDGRNIVPSADSVGKKMWDNEHFEMPADAGGPHMDGKPLPTTPTAPHKSPSNLSEEGSLSLPRTGSSYPSRRNQPALPTQVRASSYTGPFGAPDAFALIDSSSWGQGAPPSGPNWLTDRPYLPNPLPAPTYLPSWPFGGRVSRPALSG